MAAQPPELTLYANLRTIGDWIDAQQDLPAMESNNDFVGFSVEVMNRTLYLLRTGVALTHTENAARHGVNRNRAILVGHMVRLMKLYDCLLMHACENRLEICMIFFRLLLETAIRLEYLLKAKRSSFGNFVLVSYRPEKEHLSDLQRKAKQRPLIPIERRIRQSVTKRLRQDRITHKALLQNKSWDLDGKNFRALLTSAGFEDWEYSYSFGNGSHFIHGDWRDISMYHVKRRNGRYLPNPEYETTDPRPIGAATTLCLRILNRYLRRCESDPDDFVRPIVERLLALNQRLDDAHETYLQERAHPQ